MKFLALLVPSRMGVEGYQDYLDELMAAAGQVNAKHGDSDWEPIRLLVGSNYPRAVAAMQLYDVLLVNSIADGMNLVAKEGRTVNTRDGVLVLSERTGARQQLEAGAIVISTCDIYATAEALRQGLTMEPEERRVWAERLGWQIEREDITAWVCHQLETPQDLGLCGWIADRILSCVEERSIHRLCLRVRQEYTWRAIFRRDIEPLLKGVPGA